MLTRTQKNGTEQSQQTTSTTHNMDAVNKERQPSRRGFLLSKDAGSSKKKVLSTTWKKRFFIFYEATETESVKLEYCLSESSKVVGTVDLSCARISNCEDDGEDSGDKKKKRRSQKHKHCLVIETQEAKIYLSATDEDDLDAWSLALTSASTLHPDGNNCSAPQVVSAAMPSFEDPNDSLTGVAGGAPMSRQDGGSLASVAMMLAETDGDDQDSDKNDESPRTGRSRSSTAPPDVGRNLLPRLPRPKSMGLRKPLDLDSMGAQMEAEEAEDQPPMSAVEGSRLNFRRKVGRNFVNAWEGKLQKTASQAGLADGEVLRLDMMDDDDDGGSRVVRGSQRSARPGSRAGNSSVGSSSSDGADSQNNDAACEGDGVDDEDDPVVLNRREAVIELIDSEADYVEDLTTLQEVYMVPMRNKKEFLTGKPLVSAADIQIIFSNLSSITPVNQALSEKLLAMRNKRNAQQLIGQVFLNMANYLRMYAQYCANHKKATDMVSEHRKDLQFDSFLEEKRFCHQASQMLEFESFLIKPVQRICKYPLLLREVLKYTPDTHPDYAPLVEALDKLGEVASDINESKRMAEEQVKILEIQESISFPAKKHIKLFTASRRFIRDSCFSKIVVGKDSFKGKMWLFSDLVLVAKSKSKTKFTFKTSFPIQSATTFDIPEDPKSKKKAHAFTLMSPECVKVTVHAESWGDKAGWINAVEECQVKELAVTSARGSNVKNRREEFRDRRRSVTLMSSSGLLTGSDRTSLLRKESSKRLSCNIASQPS